MKIEVQLRHRTWYFRSSDFTGGRWLPSSYLGVIQFDYVRRHLQEWLNRFVEDKEGRQILSGYDPAQVYTVEEFPESEDVPFAARDRKERRNP